MPISAKQAAKRQAYKDFNGESNNIIHLEIVLVTGTQRSQS